ncbi:MAG: hypothetical protein AYK23_00345 [Candidatus Proteinoplasmatales archaeon SG8-5]|nr:MAG: hypothetical protein AYK23_00345 [Candidatus Proteinoplasmatales archaeon SG8-5]
MWLQVRYFLKAKKCIKSLNPDVLIMNDVNTLVFSRSKAGLKIYDSHELWYDLVEYHGYVRGRFGRWLFKSIEKRYSKDVDAFITVNDSMAEFLGKRLGKRFHVIRNVPLIEESDRIDIRKSNGLPNTTFIIVHSGSISENRGLNELGQLITRLYKEEVRNVSFVLYGIDKGTMKRLRMMCTKDALKQHRFHGPLSQKELYSTLKTADLGILLTKNTNLNNYHSLPNKLFEYLMNGLPVICSDFPEMRTLIEKYDVGWLVNPENTEDVNAAITQAHTDSSMLRKYKENTTRLTGDISFKQEMGILVELIEASH